MAILDVVKNEGGSQLLAWKYPGRELAAWTQLLVGEGEEAVLFIGGRPTQRFTPGRYTLKTANLPLLGSLVKLPFGGKSPFPTELWFIHTCAPLDIKWGTDLPITLLTESGAAAPSLRGYGQFGVQVADTALFLRTLRGRVPAFDNRALAAYLRSQLAPVIRAAIEACYRQIGPSFFEKADTSQLLAERLQLDAAPLLRLYGLRLSHLTVRDLCAQPENDVAKHLTFSILSVVMPPTEASPQLITAQPQPEGTRMALVMATFLLLLLLLGVFVLLWPPQQTADFVGIVLMMVAHLCTAGVLLWISARPQGLLVTLGFAVTAGLYWLGAVGVALFFRLLSIPNMGGLLALELGLAVLAALALLGFWQAREYDSY